MGLDIRFTQRKKNLCPHCGKFVNYTDVEEVESGGRVWYELLEIIGYYDPKSEHDDWYGKDMVLTEEQAKKVYKFIHIQDAYNCNEIIRLIAVALVEEDDIVINADW